MLVLAPRAGDGSCHQSNAKHQPNHCIFAQPSVEGVSIFRRQMLVFSQNFALGHGAPQAGQRSIRFAPYERDATIRTPTKTTVAITQTNSKIVTARSRGCENPIYRGARRVSSATCVEGTVGQSF